VELAPAGPVLTGQNRFQGRVAQTAFLGEATECVVQVADVTILVRGAAGQHAVADIVEVFFPPDRTLAIAVGD
jgi:hypothetical protein